MSKKIAHLPGCKCGKYKEILNKSDKWWINSPEHYNCFFTYMRHNKRKHSLQETAKLLGLSITSVISIEKKVKEKIRKKYEYLYKFLISDY